MAKSKRETKKKPETHSHGPGCTCDEITDDPNEAVQACLETAVRMSPGPAEALQILFGAVRVLEDIIDPRVSEAEFRRMIAAAKSFGQGMTDATSTVIGTLALENVSRYPSRKED
jgi:hypothetical protein